MNPDLRRSFYVDFKKRFKMTETTKLPKRKDRLINNMEQKCLELEWGEGKVDYLSGRKSLRRIARSFPDG
jgi:hypothetical protein